MTKRSAMLVAAGLVAALMVGAVGLSFGLSGNGSAQAETTAPDPIVRTIHRTVRVEKDAKGSQQPVQVVEVASAPASSATEVSDDAFDDEAYEDEDDDAFDDEAYEDEDDDAFDDDDREGDDDDDDHEGSDDSGSEHSGEDGGEHEDD